MAQLIVSVCDEHMAADQHEPGELWSFTIQAPGERPVSYLIDACADHSKAYRDVLAALAEHGRKPPKDGALAAAVAPTAPAIPSREPREHPCPVCTYVAPNRSALSSHARNQHQSSIAELTGEATPYPCPECSRRFNRPQGLAMHVSRSHPAAHPAFVAAGGAAAVREG